MSNKSVNANADAFDVLPYLTAEISGIGGEIRQEPGDFRVDEIPLYDFCGSGSHSYFQIEKVNLGTFEAINLIAQALGVKRHEIGYAGLKDATAITRQWLSVEKVSADKIRRLNIPGIKVLNITSHDNKLKLGHLAGNRFSLRISRFKCDPARAGQAAARVCEIIARRGMPNYFGPQRFGTRLDSHLLGEALIADKLERFADLMLGEPGELDKGKILQARRLYEQGHYDKACKLWPWPCSEQRKALQLLARNGGRKKKVAYLVSSDMKNFYVSAWQSYIFNQVLAARMPDLDLLLTGDMAWKHNNGSVFQVLDAGVEQARCLAGEISATGPLPGMRMQPLTGPAGEIENAILAANGVNEQVNLALKKYYARTGRRPLRVMPGELRWQVSRDRRGDYLQLDFSLPAGSYATCLLREIMK